MDPVLYEGLKSWFREYLDWILYHQHGIDEANTTNNHAVCYWLQVAVFARFTDQAEYLDLARAVYRSKLLKQMDADGCFPL